MLTWVIIIFLTFAIIFLAYFTDPERAKKSKQEKKRKKGFYLSQTIILLLSIFLGLFAAIQAENSRISKEAEQQEINALITILVSICEDSTRYDAFISELMAKKIKLESLLNHITDSLPYNKKLDDYFTIPGDDFDARISSVEYENLKDLGFHIVKDDELRLEIIKTYDQGLSLIKNREKSFRDLYPYFQVFKWKNFITVGQSGTFPAKPYNYNELISTPEFVGMYSFYHQAVELLEKDHLKFKKQLDSLKIKTLLYLKEKDLEYEFCRVK